MRKFFLIFLLSGLAQAKTIHIFGDSLFAVNNHQVAQELSDMYNWPTPGTAVIIDRSKIGATVSMIQSQYYSSHNVKIAVFNGGANDILLDSLWCATTAGDLSDKCKALIKSLIADSFADLITQMYKDGVQQILVLTSYHMRHPVTLFKQAIDYSASMWADTCAKCGCKLIDMRQYVDVYDTKFYWIDGSHPSKVGSRRIARLIYRNLEGAEPLLTEEK